MTWLMSLPTVVLVIGGLAFTLLAAVVARLTLRALIPAGERESAHGVAAPLMTGFGAVFAILIALSLASEVGYLVAAQGIVGTEAADTSRLAWAATSAGVNPAPIQSALADYLRATRTYEWHGNSAASGDDPPTAHAIANLEDAVRGAAAHPGLGTSVSTELLASLDAVTNDRRARLAAASREFPALYVIVLAVSGVALIGNATALTLRGSWRATLLVVGLSVVIGLSLALLFALGTPWRGPITVSPQPIDSVVHDLNTGYFRR